MKKTPSAFLLFKEIRGQYLGDHTVTTINGPVDPPPEGLFSFKAIYERPMDCSLKSFIERNLYIKTKIQVTGPIEKFNYTTGLQLLSLIRFPTYVNRTQRSIILSSSSIALSTGVSYKSPHVNGLHTDVWTIRVDPAEEISLTGSMKIELVSSIDDVILSISHCSKSTDCHGLIYPDMMPQWVKGVIRDLA
ncbi:hypothetical protein [Fujian dimarhabdovirus]|uniref:Uncharacterized protein n=1 Tax=Fujian dimarhabdovirus TaxID=2116366 RepID=A0A2P1GMR9_9RHAB|nr:hypothetical protein [Fujian dimarhabdovirus]